MLTGRVKPVARVRLSDGGNAKPARCNADGFAGFPLRTEKSTARCPEVIWINTVALFQRRINARELRVEGRTKTINGSDNGKADAGGDQAVFYRGCTRLIGPELCNNLLHSTSCTQVNPLLGLLALCR